MDDWLPLEQNHKIGGEKKNNESACEGGNLFVIRVTNFFLPSQSMVWVCLVLWISKTFSSSHFHNEFKANPV
jgi:hypothetical protein